MMGRRVRAVSPAVWERVFAGTPDQAGEARRFLARILDGSPRTDDALACLGELVGNTLIHSDSRLPGGRFTVCATIGAGGLVVLVADQGGRWSPDDGWDCASGDDPGLSVSGRGLKQIVDGLADRWGIEPQADSAYRLAWFKMALP